MGGMETHLQGLCEELRRSIDVQVIVANDGQRDAEDLVGGIRIARVGKLFDLASAPVCLGMARKIRQARADLVHLHLPNPIAILAYLLSGHTGRLVVTYHSDLVRQKILGTMFQPVLRRCLDRCGVVIATSPSYVETSPVLSRYRQRCRVIPYGIRVQQFEECEQAAVNRIRERYGPRIVLSVGRLTYYKGFKYLIRAMADVEGRLLIVGDGSLRADLEREARARGVVDRVVFLGEIQNRHLAPYYQAADVFALSSIARSEAFGIVQLEAMACGKPVVNTRLSSGVPFVSVDGETGVTVTPRNSHALAAAMNLLLDDPAVRAKYGEAGRRRVQREFTLEVMASRTLQLYAEVMGSSAASQPAVPRRDGR